MAEHCRLLKQGDGRPVAVGSDYCRTQRVVVRRGSCRDCDLAPPLPPSAAPRSGNDNNRRGFAARDLSLAELLNLSRAAKPRRSPAVEEDSMETVYEKAQCSADEAQRSVDEAQDAAEDAQDSAAEASAGAGVANILRRLRLERGLQVKAVAAKLGVSNSSIRNWENGYSRPSSFWMCRLDEFYDGKLLAGQVVPPPAEESEPGGEAAPVPGGFAAPEGVDDDPLPFPETDYEAEGEPAPDPNRAAEPRRDRAAEPRREPETVEAEGTDVSVAAPAADNTLRLVDGPVDWMLAELVRAEAKHPHWPADPIHAAAILAEESGELTQAALDFYYGQGSLERMKEEAVQCGAMALRFLENLGRYHDRPFGDSRAATVAGIAADLRGILERLDGRP